MGFGDAGVGNHKPSLLETAFPALAVSLVAAADRRTKDPAYGAHGWWARRPPAVMRAILLAAVLDGGATDEEFWSAYSDPDSQPLKGLSVLDPFMGGGTTLVEAARLGADVAGCDVDPTSESIVAHALSPVPESEVSGAGRELLEFLSDNFDSLYPGPDEPLHYFWLHIVTCPDCQTSGPLYRSLTLVRDAQRLGAVVRDSGQIVFDPESFELYELQKFDQKTFRSGRRRRRVNSSNYKASRYECPACGRRSTHREVQTGAAPRRLVAVEVTAPSRRRRLVSPSPRDLEVLRLAQEMVADPPVELRLPVAQFKLERHDPRPRSYGINNVSDLFTPRQQLVLGAAHTWVDTNRNLSEAARGALRLALSNALTTNNRLCSYATDYGRLSALFSVRGYAIPWLPVELNPLHASGGRGTLRQAIARVAKSADMSVRRSFWNTSRREVQTRVFDLPPRAGSVHLQCSSAADLEPSDVDLLVFDPPYFDYIVYDELAELFRAWNGNGVGLGGQTLQSATDDGDRFGVSLADCIRPAVGSRLAGRPIAFTYHSSNPDAWAAIGITLDEAKLRVTALWPVRSDGHMGHHSHPGNCEWDVVVVARPVGETTPVGAVSSGSDWTEHFGDFDVGDADLKNFELAQAMALERYGIVAQTSKD